METFNEYRNKIGHIVIPLSRVLVMEKFRGDLGICDWCSKPDEQGFLIPVLGMKWSCTKCKENWETRAIYYPEDAEYEERVALRMLRQVGILKTI